MHDCCWVTQSCSTFCDPMDYSMTGFPVLYHLLELALTHVHWVGDTIQPSHPLCCPLLLPSIFPSIRVFSNESVLHIRWTKYWSFSLSPCNEYSGLISLMILWFHLLASKGLSRVFSNTTVQKHQFFSTQLSSIVQLSHPYMTNGKTIALTKWTFAGKVMSLLYNILSSLVIAFLPRSKCLLISWLQSLSTVVLEPKKIKSVTVSTVSSSIHHEVMGPDAMILAFRLLSFKPAFSLSSFTFKRFFSSSLLYAIRVVSSAYLRLFIFLPEILISSLCFIQPSVSHDVLCM